MPEILDNYEELPVGDSITDNCLISIVETLGGIPILDAEWEPCNAPVGTVLTQEDYDKGVRILFPIKPA